MIEVDLGGAPVAYGLSFDDISALAPWYRARRNVPGRPKRFGPQLALAKPQSRVSIGSLLAGSRPSNLQACRLPQPFRVSAVP